MIQMQTNLDVADNSGARQALALGAAKLPIKTKFVKKLNSDLGAE